MEEELKEQSKTGAEHLKPWQFKPGQSGNPNGRPPGPSLKEWSKSYLAGMNDEERKDFMTGIDKKVIWEMAEGKPEAKTEGSLTVQVTDFDDEQKRAIAERLLKQSGGPTE